MNRKHAPRDPGDGLVVYQGAADYDLQIFNRGKRVRWRGPSTPHSACRRSG
jgi:hypothetical protein